LTKLSEFTCVETFCGAGGLGVGLKKAGFDLLWAFDYDQMAVKTYFYNVSTKVATSDAYKMTPKKIMEKAGIKKGELTLLSGGPPCQGFSRQKRNGENGDRRNRLIAKYIRFVVDIQPKFFLMENVDTFQKKRGKNYLELLKNFLSDYYKIQVYEVNCADYGIPQLRKRTMVIGIRKDLNLSYNFPPPTHSPDKWITVGEALKGLPEPPPNGKEHQEIPNHYITQITDINIERISYVPQGSGRKCIPRRLQLPCHKKSDGWPDVYGRMSANKPAPTITGGFDNFTRGRYAHPFKNRPITPREAAILQSFDPKFRFYGTKRDIRSQIGNAVPPKLGEIIGRSIIQAIQEQTKVITSYDNCQTQQELEMVCEAL
jgi:DNA (cytosine-5)-methyltransferase 1